jgi:hypothetical protein
MKENKFMTLTARRLFYDFVQEHIPELSMLLLERGHPPSVVAEVKRTISDLPQAWRELDFRFAEMQQDDCDRRARLEEEEERMEREMAEKPAVESQMEKSETQEPRKEALPDASQAFPRISKAAIQASQATADYPKMPTDQVKLGTAKAPAADQGMKR